MAANDLTITAANVLSSGAGRSVIAGATVTRGMPVYKDTADNNEYKPCINSSAAAALCDGIALNDAGNGQPLTISSDGDTITIGATLAIGSHYVVSDVSGKITLDTDLSTGMRCTSLGMAVTTTTFVQNIQVGGTVHA